MRLTILAFLVVAALFVDAVKFGGYYRTQTLNAIERAIHWTMARVSR